MRIAWAVMVLGVCGGLAVLLTIAMLDLPVPAVDLRHQVQSHLHESGVSHPVTAVLLNFRGYDTLLEVAVLLLALLGVLAGTEVEKRHRAIGMRRGLPLLLNFTRLLAPWIVLVAAYLVWAGSHRPGGAFQAAGVLAGAAVLLHLSRLMAAWSTPRPWQRWMLVGGFLVFLLIGAIPTATLGGMLLEYPSHQAGTLILLIEVSLTVSLGMLLAGLFLDLSDEGMEFRK